MPKFLVSGGRQAADSHALQEWSRSEAGLLLLVDTDTSRVVPLLEYVTDPTLLSDSERMGTTLKCGEVAGENLYIATEWEVLCIHLPTLTIKQRWSFSFFNDVHAVTLRGDNLVVTSTGLDAVFEITQSGECVNAWSVLQDEDVWARFDRRKDYRKVPSTKPHASHPNFSTILDGEIWTTRFIQKDAVCLTRPDLAPVNIGLERPHDGHLIEGLLHYTTVNGCVVMINPNTRETHKILDLNTCKRDVRPLGWCRGLAREGDTLFLGFSRLRPTKLLSNLGWVKDIRRNLSTSVSRPTRMGLYSVTEARHIKDIDLEPYGLNILFSIVPLSDELAHQVEQVAR